VTKVATSNNASASASKNNIGEIYYGQQCSPNCGCAVRFEANIDRNNSNNRILSMTYDAKTIVSTASHSSKQGSMTLSPVYTLSANRGKPLITDCKCQTAHSLARAVVERLPTMTLSQAQNQLEFLGVRSSPSFRYTVLRKQNLLQDDCNKTSNSSNNTTAISQLQNVQESIVNVKYGHCFDLIEDALTACLNGYMPKPRRVAKANELHNKKSKDIHSHYYLNSLIEEMDKSNTIGEQPTNELDPLRFVNAAKRRARLLFNSNSSSSSGSSLSSSSSSSMPPFHLMGSSAEDHYDTLSQLRFDVNQLQKEDETENENSTNHILDNWLSYVDERERSEGSY
jgi:hypothetical protein